MSEDRLGRETMIVCERHMAWMNATFDPEDVPDMVEICKELLYMKLRNRGVNRFYYERCNPMGCFVCMEGEELLNDAFHIMLEQAKKAEQEVVADEG
jgi:hypothetical protein